MFTAKFRYENICSDIENIKAPKTLHYPMIFAYLTIYAGCFHACDPQGGLYRLG